MRFFPIRWSRPESLKVAIFGGTFDPIHSAHLTVAREAADEFHLDRVLFVPAANPPHKTETTTPYGHRYAMVEMACAADPRFVASRLEEGSDKSFSLHTIQKVRATLGADDRLYFLIGADAFAEIETWYRAEDVMELVEFVVVTRPGHEYETPPRARVHRLETLALPVSSSEIRQKLAAGESPGELPPAVLEYIKSQRLYR
ncbi:MAG: putative nicotinate-nucleotide adenylyltransferase [Bryobacteraceae bacterium]|nr:putative nicotinate-nucleotide adenylyltransferase [Bryobacteraceae bacterium]